MTNKRKRQRLKVAAGMVASLKAELRTAQEKLAMYEAVIGDLMEVKTGAAPAEVVTLLAKHLKANGFAWTKSNLFGVEQATYELWRGAVFEDRYRSGLEFFTERGASLAPAQPLPRTPAGRMLMMNDLMELARYEREYPPGVPLPPVVAPSDDESVFRREYLGEFPAPVVHQSGNGGENLALCGQPLDMSPSSTVTCPECLALLYPPGAGR
jgi:hypothetical protein